MNYDKTIFKFIKAIRSSSRYLVIIIKASSIFITIIKSIYYFKRKISIYY